MSKLSILVFWLDNMTLYSAPTKISLLGVMSQIFPVNEFLEQYFALVQKTQGIGKTNSLVATYSHIFLFRSLHSLQIKKLSNCWAWSVSFPNFLSDFWQALPFGLTVRRSLKSYIQSKLSIRIFLVLPNASLFTTYLWSKLANWSRLMVHYQFNSYLEFFV